MTIVIPMAGLSSRFSKAGFILPKYMLYVGNQSLFSLSVNSFEHYFHKARFLFIVRDIFDTNRFVQLECERLGIKDFQIVTLERETRGQAETVYLGTKAVGLKPEESILIFNIDTIRDHFVMPLEADVWDGFLEVFEGSGPNWSYARTAGDVSTRVVETTEKIQISNYCSNGIYYFSRSSDFWRIFEQGMRNTGSGQAAELYVAPLYNALIAEGKNVHIQVVDSKLIHFCGVPTEYHNMQKLFYNKLTDLKA